MSAIKEERGITRGDGEKWGRERMKGGRLGGEKGRKLVGERKGKDEGGRNRKG